MVANPDAGALLLVKKFGALALIFFGILGIAVGLEYRSPDSQSGLLSRGLPLFSVA